MKITSNTRLLVGTTAVVALIGGDLVSQQRAGLNDDKYQHKSLNAAFAVIKPDKDKVRVVVKPYRHMVPGAGNRDLRVGSQFRIAERHFSYKYRVKAIDSDGIRISYTGRNDIDREGTVGRAGDVRGFVAGEVKLKWKP